MRVVASRQVPREMQTNQVGNAFLGNAQALACGTMLSQFHVPLALKAFGAKIQFHFAGNLPFHAMLDQPKAKSAALGYPHRGAAMFFPDEVYGIAVGKKRPAHMDRARGVRQCAVFRSVGGQFMKGHAQGQCPLGRQMYSRARHLEAQMLILAPGRKARRTTPSKDAPSQLSKVSKSCWLDRANRRARKASRGAPRSTPFMVWIAIACTVARVFFTR